MKRTKRTFCRLFFCILAILIFCGCTSVQSLSTVPPEMTASTISRMQGNSTVEPSEQLDAFPDCTITSRQKSIYYDRESHFQEYYTPDEYIKLCSVISEMAAEPCFAISSQSAVVRQKIETYNSMELNYYVIDTSGNVLIDYGNNSWVNDISGNRISLGGFTFIKTQGNPLQYDIVNDKGVRVNSIKFDDDPIFSPVASLGDEYYLFVVVWEFDPAVYDMFILQPSGDCVSVEELPGYWRARVRANMSDTETSYISCELDAVIGQLKDGVFPICYAYSSTDGIYTCAFYSNANGKILINLSSIEMNFHVKTLGSFTDGYAQVDFAGSDGKEYTVLIDKEGNFVDEPVLKQ